jgi:tRNA-specific 2-thiouridylase
MSGGVDSSVMAALLHRAGFEVIGISMQLFNKKNAGSSDGKCCTLDDFQDARRVAYQLGFRHYVMDFEQRFRDTVIEDFIQNYLDGETPSPCIKCNQYLKFSSLMERADELGASFVATGHYATARFQRDLWHLHKASDPAKDQSYFLFHHTQATLARTLFPLAHLSKTEVRALATMLGLHLAEKAESQEICFVTQDRYDEFIEAEGRQPEQGTGEIRHLDGRLLGHHRGFWRHTVGQRRGLGISHPTPLYVIRLDPATSTVWVGGEGDLLGKNLIAKDLNWIQAIPAAPLSCEARIRSRSAEAEALVIPLDAGRVQVSFLDPQRAIAPGQAVVFYQDGEVLGGGWISHPGCDLQPMGGKLA